MLEELEDFEMVGATEEVDEREVKLGEQEKLVRKWR